MNPYNLIGFLLVLFYATNRVHAVPIASEASDLAVTAENRTAVQNNDEKLDNLQYTIVDVIESSKNLDHDATTIEQTTQKPQSETQKPNSMVRRHVKKSKTRRRPRTQPDCRSPTTVKPTTPRPTQVVVQLPNIFISQTGWGPGR
ncbi:uncharacterized protein LOC129568747 isoform X2 [Sitodiplosis mosellana]|nr:uncharacterized protein LOC129568747 isoform X2 [Sitodiplosis mosellana]